MLNNVIHDTVFVEFELKNILKKMLNDVGRLLSTRKDQIAPKYRGIWGDTQTYVMRPLPKPAAALVGDKHFKNTRRQTNAILDKLACTYDFAVLNIDVINCSQKVLFEKSGQLSDYGKEKFWTFISDTLSPKQRRVVHAIANAHSITQDVAVQVNETEIQETNKWLRNEQNSNSFNRSWSEDYHSRHAPHNPGYNKYHTRYDRGDAYNDEYHRRQSYYEDNNF